MTIESNIDDASHIDNSILSDVSQQNATNVFFEEEENMVNNAEATEGVKEVGTSLQCLPYLSQTFCFLH